MFLDHVHFKPNIHLLSNKNEQSAVYSILSQPQSQSPSQQQQQSAFNDNSTSNMFTVRQPDNLSTGLRTESNEHDQLTFNTQGGDTNSTLTFNTGQQLSQPPQIFSASINGANLMSTTGSDGGHLANQDKMVESNTTNQYGINLGNNLHIGLPTMTGTSSDHLQDAGSRGIQYLQQSTSQSSNEIEYVQTSSGYQVICMANKK